jgi:hypothetical protein
LFGQGHEQSKLSNDCSGAMALAPNQRPAPHSFVYLRVLGG